MRSGVTAVTRRTIHLRIDVDFLSGWIDAVPFFLDTLDRHAMRATFFGVVGFNRIGGSLKRLGDAAYRRRYWQLGPWQSYRCLRHDRSVQRPMIEYNEVRDAIRSIQSRGHEFALHGWDHGWWADHVWQAPRERLEMEVDRAYAAVESETPLAWGSPNWRSRDDLERCWQRHQTPYLSEGWGSEPLRVAGRVNLPVTDCLEPQRLQQRRATDEQLVGSWLDEIVARPYTLLCVHDYFEGLMQRPLFSRLIEETARRQIAIAPLQDVVATLDPPQGHFERDQVDGFVGEVSRTHVLPSASCM